MMYPRWDRTFKEGYKRSKNIHPEAHYIIWETQKFITISVDQFSVFCDIDQNMQNNVLIN